MELKFANVNEYQNYLFQNNTSDSTTSFASQNQLQEVVLALQCVLTRIPVQIPIKHNKVGNLNCVFEMNVWLEFFSDSLAQGAEADFRCPGCRKFVQFINFGVDYTLYQVLAQKQFYENQYGAVLMKEKIIFSTAEGQPEYFGILKEDKKTKVLLPGCNPITKHYKTTNKNHQFNLTNQTQVSIYCQIEETISKIQKVLAKRFYNIRQKEVDTKHYYQKLENMSEQLKDKFKQSFCLIELGLKSLKNNMVFGMKKIKVNGKYSGSLLVIYYPYYGIWKAYEILTSPESHFQYEQALYIKDESHNNETIIYIIGGRISYWEQTDQFVKIKIPKDPFDESDNLKVEYLHNLPQKGFNFLGGVYKDKVYILCGQQRYVGNNYATIEEILNAAYVYQDEKWVLLNEKVEKRYDGSQILYNDPNQGEMIMLYGGTATVSAGQLGYNNPEQQHICQIFSLQQSKFIGNGLKLKFSDNPDLKYQKYMLSAPLFSIPFTKDKHLIIGGNHLRKNCQGAKEIFTIDIKEGLVQLNELQSVSQIEKELLTYLRTSKYSSTELFQPVQDLQGTLLFGKYYTIFGEETQLDSQKVQVWISAFEYTQANGANELIPYQSRKRSIEIAKSKLNEMVDGENKNILS